MKHAIPIHDSFVKVKLYRKKQVNRDLGWNHQQDPS